MKRTTLTIPRRGSVAAAEAALGSDWLIGLGLLVVERVSCILWSSGLADGLQPSTRRRQANNSTAQSPDMCDTWVGATDPIIVAGSADL